MSNALMSSPMRLEAQACLGVMASSTSHFPAFSRILEPKAQECKIDGSREARNVKNEFNGPQPVLNGIEGKSECYVSNDNRPYPYLAIIARYGRRGYLFNGKDFTGSAVDRDAAAIASYR